MKMTHSRLMKIGLRLITVLLSTLAALTVHTTSSAKQQIVDPHFGLYNAYEAPQAVSELGAGWELIDFRWDVMQPGGPTDWDPSSDINAWLTTARTSGREVVGVLYATPAWASSGNPVTGVPAGLDLPTGDPGNVWAAFVRQMVSYYGSRGINRWVIWKSPDLPLSYKEAQWAGSTEEYYQLVKVAYTVAKEANPNAYIHLGAISDRDPAWLGRFLDIALEDSSAAANNYYFDVASVNAYFATDRVWTSTANPYQLMSIRGVPLKPVWVNEVNARPGIDPLAYPSTSAFDRHQNITLDQQAAFIIQSFALGLSAGAERMAVYRMADNFEEDDQQGYGLVRTDESRRPAYDAYRLVVEEFSGFIFARRVDEETFPLVDYVRLTFADKVTHVAWARADITSTLIIPARSQQATLIDMYGNRYTVTPEDGFNYRVVLGGAVCDDPSEGCLIGGNPWLLVEENVENAVDEVPPEVAVEEGGELPTPDPNALLPTEVPPPTPEPVEPPTEEQPAEVEQPAEAESPISIPEVAEASPAEAPAEEEAPAVEAENPPDQQFLSAEQIEAQVRPQGFAAILPYGLMILGGLAIVGGVAFFVIQRRRDSSYLMPTQEHARPDFDDAEGDEPEEHLMPTQEHDRPDFDDVTQEHERPDFDDVEDEDFFEPEDDDYPESFEEDEDDV